MPNYQKLMAMFWSGLGALLLIQMGYVEVGAALLGTILGFAVGEANGVKNERKKQTDS